MVDFEDGGTLKVVRKAARKAMRLGVVLIGLFALPGCSGDEVIVPAEMLRPPVMVARVATRDVVDRISATGQLTAKAQATIAAQVEGQVTEIRALEGSSIEAGDVLLVIDPERRELEVARGEAELAEAAAELAVARRNLGRTNRLSLGNVASEARVDEDRTRESMAKSVHAGAKARLGLARRSLEDATVRAPFSGMIARRHVSVGEYLTIGTALFEIVALDPIEVEFTLAEVDSSKVALGYPVEVTTAPNPNEILNATVSMISPTIEPRTRTLRVKAELPNHDGRIRPGLFAHIDLGVSERLGVITVPEDAVLQRADGTIVFRLVEENRVRRVQVETGTHGDGWIEITHGLESDDRVVVRGQSRIDDGIVVSLRNAEGDPVELPQSNSSGPEAEELAEGKAR